MKCGNIRERLIKKALTSHCRFRISAIGIDNRGRIIASATNSHRFLRHGGGLHAEQRVMMHCPRSLKTIIICRIGNGGALLPIHPCVKCKRMADTRGVKILTLGN